MWRIFLASALFISCSTSEKKEASLESWQGLRVEEIEKHSYFQHLPKKIQHNPQTGEELWTLLDQGRLQTDAYCQSLGGCMGIPSYNCQSVFTVKEGKILGLRQDGVCPGPRTIEAGSKN